MSNSGKTYWSKKLERFGFLRFGCDDFIAERLTTVLKDQNLSNISDVAHWLSQPYEANYRNNAETYLDLEAQSITFALSQLVNNNAVKDYVIDATGSVVYIEPKILSALKKQTTVVYIKISPAMREKIYQKFLQFPKPIIWGNSFQMREGQLPREALTQSYPKLLEYRSQQYEKLADVTIDYEKLQNGMLTQEFIELLHSNS
ncbi:hypothetical protein C4565_01320 [Candidatus Parcubacteria bacterium]|nr:MAG: hypothetical protein C4565_01320 [Candidatus Parcubacteria bacterium]